MDHPQLAEQQNNLSIHVTTHRAETAISTDVDTERMTIERERRRIHQRQRRENMTNEQREHERELNRIRYRRRMENLTDEQRSLQSEQRRRRRENMTEEQRSLERERQRNSYRRRMERIRNITNSQNLTLGNGSTSENQVEHDHAEVNINAGVGNNSQHIVPPEFEQMQAEVNRNVGVGGNSQHAPPENRSININQVVQLINQHVQAEVNRIGGCSSTMTLNIDGGSMQLASQNRNSSRLRFEDVVIDAELDSNAHGNDDEERENAEEYMIAQEGHADNIATHETNRITGMLPTNRGYHNCAREFVDSQLLPRLQFTNITACTHCQAKLFPHETMELCCLHGKVRLPPLPVPTELMQLFTLQSEEGKHFRKNIRAYNHVFAFTSIGVHVDETLANARDGVYTYRAQGAIYHRIGSLIPQPGNRPRYLQMYIYDTDHEMENRMMESGLVNRQVLTILKRVLDTYNPFVQVFRQIAQCHDLSTIRLHIRDQPIDRHQYNMPTSSQVAGILVGGEDPIEQNERDIIVETSSGHLINVPDTACFYDPLQYPISTCHISKQSNLAELLRKASLIIWDEATMTHRHAFEALDRTLRDITGNNLPFGGKIFVLGGDFRQVLPVVQNGTRTQIIDACITNSSFWQHVNIIRLTENMRARLDPLFSQFLLRIGDGIEPFVTDDMIKLPEDISMAWEGDQPLRNLIDKVFPSLEENARDKNYMTQRALITPKNEFVDTLNQEVINIFPGEEKTYFSFDTVENDIQNLYPQEFLNSISPGGLPPHKLTLKLGAPIILLRNLDPKNGLCNGTRLLCRAFQRNIIDAEIVTGNCAGRRVFIPRIPLRPSDNLKLPFVLTRKQFPVRLSFALTINKSQGQTIPHVGVYLPQHVFGHGQLYVALSRGISRNTTKVLVKKGILNGFNGIHTRNVVYHDVLQSCNPTIQSS